MSGIKLYNEVVMMCGMLANRYNWERSHTENMRGYTQFHVDDGIFEINYNSRTNEVEIIFGDDYAVVPDATWVEDVLASFNLIP